MDAKKDESQKKDDEPRINDIIRALCIKKMSNDRPCDDDDEGKDNKKETCYRSQSKASGIKRDKGEHTAIGKKDQAPK